MSTFVINIAKQFSKTPNARYKTDGANSGEAFYEKLLSPEFRKALEAGQKLTIVLDGTEGYATSFLDEAFCRLAKEFKPDVVWNNIELVSVEEPDWIEEVHDYIFGLQHEDA